MMARALIWLMDISACAKYRIADEIVITKWTRVNQIVAKMVQDARQARIIKISRVAARWDIPADCAIKILMSVLLIKVSACFFFTYSKKNRFKSMKKKSFY